MAISHITSIRTTFATAVRDAIDAGAGAGKLVFLTSSDITVATLTLSDPCGVVLNGLLTFSAISSDTNAIGGTIAKFKVTTSAAADVYYGTVTVTGGGGDIEISTLAITPGDTIAVPVLIYSATA